MTRFCLVCKTYRGDIDRFGVLLNSINKFNKDDLDLWVILPTSDMNLFNNKFGKLNTLSEEYFSQLLNIPEELKNNGWINQQIYKSAIHKASGIDFYLQIDSDSIFIKDFYLKDFIHDENNPYTICHEQKELFSWTSSEGGQFHDMIKTSYNDIRNNIKNVFGRTGINYDFGPSPIICSTKVWKWLEDEYCVSNNLNFYEIFYKYPSEFTWYGESFLQSEIHQMFPREPLFKVFHYAKQYTEYKSKGITLEQISQNYFGIVMQSNWGAPLEY